MCQRLICSLPIETGSTLTPMIVAGFSNAVAWLAAQLKAYPAVQAIEILNEPDNVYRLSEGSNWKQKYITLLNSAYTVMKTVSPQMTVIGLGAQAGDDFCHDVLRSKCRRVNGHPYAPSLPVPKTTYEPPYSTFTEFCKAWVQYDQHDTRPRWDTT